MNTGKEILKKFKNITIDDFLIKFNILLQK